MAAPIAAATGAGPAGLPRAPGFAPAWLRAGGGFWDRLAVVRTVTGLASDPLLPCGVLMLMVPRRSV